MENPSIKPSEEILKALDEIDDTNFEETTKRKTRKRSSILKQPKIPEDEQAEDLQNKRKSCSTKRRVSFADKFQVMELCTGNIYDIPGKSVSASDSTLSGDLNSVSKSEAGNSNCTSKLEIPDHNIHISKNEIQVSLSTDTVNSTQEVCSSLPYSKKHKINSDEAIEPERKRIIVSDTNSLPVVQEKNSVFNYGESLISEFHNILFGNDCKMNERNQDMELTLMQNVDTRITPTDCNMEENSNLKEKFCDLTNSKSVSLNKRDRNILSNTENAYKNDKTNSILKTLDTKSDLKNAILSPQKNTFCLNSDNKVFHTNVLKDTPNVIVLPISVCDIPLEENKENIYFDVKNKNILVTNARDLKLSSKVSEKFLSSAAMSALNDERFNPVSAKNHTIFKHKKKSFLNKTCIFNNPMELTCIPSEVDQTNELEKLVNDDSIEDENISSPRKCDMTGQLNEIKLDKSYFMELTCNVQDLTDSVCSANNNYDGKNSKNPSVIFGDKDETVAFMEMTCNVEDISDSVTLLSETDDIVKNTLVQNIIFNKENTKERKVNSVANYAETNCCTSFEMESTCEIKNKISLSNFSKANNEHADIQLEAETFFCSNEELNNPDGSVDVNHVLSEDKCKSPFMLKDIDSASSKTEKKKFNLSQDHERVKIGYDKMELTCFGNDISIEKTDISEVSVNDMSTSDFEDIEMQSKLYDDVFTQDDSRVKHPKFNFLHDSERNEPCTPFEKFNSSRNEFSDDNPKSIVDKRTQYFTSDYMELTSKSCLDENKIKSAISAKNFSNTKCFSSFEMDLTCNTIHSHTKRQIYSQDEKSVEDDCTPNIIHPAKHQKLEFLYNSEKSKLNIRSEKMSSTGAKMNFHGLPNSVDSSENPPVSLSNKTQHFTSDLMELTSKTCLAKDEGDKSQFCNPVTNLAKSLSKTKHFSSLGMELTCDIGADVRRKCFSENEALSVRDCTVNETHNPQKNILRISKNLDIVRDEKKCQDFPKSACLSAENHNSIANKTHHFTFDSMKLNPGIHSVEEKNADSVQNFAKTKYFSSYGMEMTCNLQNENDIEESSPPNIMPQTKRLKNRDSESNYIETNTDRCLEIQSCDKNDSQLTMGEICSINTDSILAEVEKLQCNSKLLEKSNILCTDYSLTTTRNANGDLRKQTLNLSTSLETPNLAVDVNNINKSLNSPKKNYNEDGVDHDFDSKLIKSTKFSDCDIVYAIKQVKGMNQASANDYNVFKFPEVFFSLKKGVIPKTSFSCSRIQLTKAVQDAIRRSSSFSYAPSEQTLIGDFKKRYTGSSSKTGELTKLDKSAVKNTEESDAPILKNSANINIPSNSKIVESISSCKKIKKSLFIEYCSSPRQNASTIKDYELTKNNCSPFINNSPDTSNCLRRSLNFEKEITCNVPSIVISHVHEESIIENTTTFTAVAEDTFPDGSEFCLDHCSISLVPNDDTLDSISLKSDSEAFKKLNFTKCINEPLDPLNEISLKNSENVSNFPCVSETQKNINKISESNSRVLNANCDIGVEEMNKNCRSDGNITDRTYIPVLLASMEHNIADNNFLESYNENILKDKCATEMVDADKGCKMMSNELRENHKRSKCKLPFLSKTNMTSCENTVSENQNPCKSEDCFIQLNKTNAFSEEHEQIINKGSPHKISNISDRNTVNKFSKQKQNVKPYANDLQTTEKVKEIIINETVALDTCPANPEKCNGEFIESNNEHTKTNKLVNTATNKNEKNRDDACYLNSLTLLKNKVQNVCQDSIIEKVTYASQQSCSTKVMNEETIMQVSKRHGSDLGKTFISNQPNHTIQLKDQISDTSHTENCVALEKQNPSILGNAMINKEVEKNLVLTKLQSDKASPLTPSKQSKDQIVESSTLSKDIQNSRIVKECKTTLPVISKNSELMKRVQLENYSDRCLEKSASNVLPEDNIGENLCNKDMDVENSSTLQDNIPENDEYFYYERIHSLRKKIMAAAENSNCLWDLREMDDKQAIFEILYESIFACYFMYADLQFTPKTVLCTKISFKHLKEEPDERDELGFSLFKYLISNEKEMFPFPADDFPDKLVKIVDFALATKSLISDVWCVAIKNEISIDNSSDLPELCVKVLNENYFSHFLLKFPIDVKSYPKKKIIPEVKHLEFNPYKKEIILDALNKVEPGEKYLSNMAEAANTLYSNGISM